MSDKEKILKILEKIRDEYNIGYDYLYYKGTQLLNEKTLSLLKKSIKNNIKNPSKDIKVFIVGFSIFEKNIENKKPVFHIQCVQYTITSKLNLICKEDDFGYTFTFSSEELLKYGLKSSYIPKMIDAVKNNLVNFSKDSISLTEFLNLKKK